MDFKTLWAEYKEKGSELLQGVNEWNEMLKEQLKQGGMEETPNFIITMINMRAKKIQELEKMTTDLRDAYENSPLTKHMKTLNPEQKANFQKLPIAQNHPSLREISKAIEANKVDADPFEWHDPNCIADLYNQQDLIDRVNGCKNLIKVYERAEKTAEKTADNEGLNTISTYLDKEYSKLEHELAKYSKDLDPRPNSVPNQLKTFLLELKPEVTAVTLNQDHITELLNNLEASTLSSDEAVSVIGCEETIDSHHG